MKKIITMLLALCMMASTVACSSGDNESSSVSDSNSSEAQTSSTTAEKQDVGGLQLPLSLDSGIPGSFRLFCYWITWL